ncbi:MAG: divalent-cation tolerance protein CutA [Pirellulales bacterium]
MTDYVQVVTTLSNQDDAERIARSLVEQRLAACVQIEGPIRSIYWWQDKMESAVEWRLVAKTRRDLYRDLEQSLATVHPFDVPEIVAVPILAGHPGYLEWLEKELPGRRPQGT